MNRFDRYATPLFITVLTGTLGYAIFTLPAPEQTLGLLVEKHLAQSGVTNPVTAVLLNFRGYDTLLEMAVLLTALIAVRVLREAPLSHRVGPDGFLLRFSSLLLPILLVFALYLLWAGAHAPGGAFQAGSVLGAAGVIALLAGLRSPVRFPERFPEALSVIGLAGFIFAAAAGILYGRGLLAYPPQQAAAWIFGIEAAASLSIGITLGTLFLILLPREKVNP